MPSQTVFDEAKRLVRSYSDDLEAQQDDAVLGQALIRQEKEDQQVEPSKHDRDQEWIAFMNGTTPKPGDEGENALRVKAEKLLAAWQTFVKKMNKKFPDNPIPLNQAPDLGLLMQTVSDAQMTWQDERENTKLGQVRKGFGSFVQVCNDYKAFFDVIPSGDKYISLLTGSLSAFAKASLTHEETAAAIDDALQQVHENMEFWPRQMQTFRDSPHMKKLMIDAYVAIFEMYTDIFVHWNASRLHRFWKSFDANFVNEVVGNKMTEVARIKKRMEDETHLLTQSKIHNEMVTHEDLRRLLKNLEGRLGKIVQGSRRWEAVDYLNTSLIGLPQQSSTTPSGDTFDIEEIDESHSDEELGPSSTDQEKASARTKSIPDVNAFVQLVHSLLRVGLLQDHQETYAFLQALYPRMKVNVVVYRAINNWLSGNQLHNLWIEGPYGAAWPSQNTTMAAFLTSTAVDSDVAVISYFVRTQNVARRGGKTQSEALVAIAQCLILQLLTYLDPTGFSKGVLPDKCHELSSTRTLDGQETMGLLQALVESRSRTLLCIIDGFYLLDNTKDTAYLALLQQFLEIMCPQSASEEASALRTCFTTDAHSACLMKLVSAGRVTRIAFEVETKEEEGEDDRELIVGVSL